MEKEGLKRCLQFLKNERLSVKTLITDRHTQIRKYMREKWPRVKHRLDGWHVGKGIPFSGDIIIVIMTSSHIVITRKLFLLL